MAVSSPAPVIAAAILRAQRRIAAHFLVHHAVSAQDAVAFVPERRIARHQFERMRQRGIIHAAGQGRFWLDMAAYRAAAERRRAIMVPVVIVLCVIAAGLIVLGYRH